VAFLVVRLEKFGVGEHRLHLVPDQLVGLGHRDHSSGAGPRGVPRVPIRADVEAATPIPGPLDPSAAAATDDEAPEEILVLFVVPDSPLPILGQLLLRQPERLRIDDRRHAHGNPFLARPGRPAAQIPGVHVLEASPLVRSVGVDPRHLVVIALSRVDRTPEHVDDMTLPPSPK
jgi:hypothetical protein